MGPSHRSQLYPLGGMTEKSLFAFLYKGRKLCSKDPTHQPHKSPCPGNANMLAFSLLSQAVWSLEMAQ